MLYNIKEEVQKYHNQNKRRSQRINAQLANHYGDGLNPAGSVDGEPSVDYLLRLFWYRFPNLASDLLYGTRFTYKIKEEKEKKKLDKNKIIPYN